MASPNFNTERAASVLVAACFMTDAEAAEKHGLSRQSVLNYRRRLDPEHDSFTPELVQLFTTKLNETRKDADDWLDDVERTIQVALSAVRRCANELDPADPEALIALTSALKVLSETHLTKQVIDARLAESNRQPQPPAHEGSAFGAPRGVA